MTHYIGIDVSKTKLDSAQIRDIDKSKYKTKVFKNEPCDFATIVTLLKSNVSDDLTDIHITVEATGVYHENIAYYLYDEYLRVSIVNPAFVRSYANSLGSRHKTDKQDSTLLARFAHNTKPNLLTPPPAEVRAKVEAICKELPVYEKNQ